MQYTTLLESCINFGSTSPPKKRITTQGGVPKIKNIRIVGGKCKYLVQIYVLPNSNPPFSVYRYTQEANNYVVNLISILSESTDINHKLNCRQEV
uniref:Uncharacterized protein n=1 Tax=Arundo donax TaxID=35708 RepID=A0A0A9A895_ARUDO